jgi:hypothetical protein
LSLITNNLSFFLPKELTFFLPEVVRLVVPNVIFYERFVGKFSEIVLCLRISRVSQPKKNAVQQIRRQNWAILEKLQDSANSQVELGDS